MAMHAYRFLHAALLCTAEFGSGNVSDNRKHFQSGAFGGGSSNVLASEVGTFSRANRRSESESEPTFSSICT